MRGLGRIPQPVRIVASQDLNFAGTALKASRDLSPLWLCHGPNSAGIETWRDACDQLIEVPKAGDGQLDLSAMLENLGAQGLTSVFCEGGGRLAASLLKVDLVDDVIVYTAGLVLGADGLAGVADLGIERLQEAQRFGLVSCRQIGVDIRQHWRVSV